LVYRTSEGDIVKEFYPYILKDGQLVLAMERSEENGPLNYISSLTNAERKSIEKRRISFLREENRIVSRLKERNDRSDDNMFLTPQIMKTSLGECQWCERLAGEDLKRIFDEADQIPPKPFRERVIEVISYMILLFEEIAFYHGENTQSASEDVILHLDIKAENFVAIKSRNEHVAVRNLDFGSATFAKKLIEDIKSFKNGSELQGQDLINEIMAAYFVCSPRYYDMRKDGQIARIIRDIVCEPNQEEGDVSSANHALWVERLKNLDIRAGLRTMLLALMDAPMEQRLDDQMEWRWFKKILASQSNELLTSGSSFEKYYAFALLNELMGRCFGQNSKEWLTATEVADRFRGILCVLGVKPPTAAQKHYVDMMRVYRGKDYLLENNNLFSIEDILYFCCKKQLDECDLAGLYWFLLTGRKRKRQGRDRSSPRRAQKANREEDRLPKIDFRLFPDIRYGQKCYSKYDSDRKVMTEDCVIPLLKAFDDPEVAKHKHLFLVGNGSLGKSTSLEILEAELLCRYRNTGTAGLCHLYECKRLDDRNKLRTIKALAQRSEGAVFAFDAYDELPKGIDEAFVSLINELNKLNIRIIISSRADPDDWSESPTQRKVFDDYGRLRLCHFDDEQLEFVVGEKVEQDSLLRSTMFLRMYLELSKERDEYCIYASIKNEAEFIEHYFEVLFLQKNKGRGPDVARTDFIHLGRYLHRQRWGRSNRNREPIPTELQHIFFYRNNNRIDAIQSKYLNYIHAVYVKETLLEIEDDRRWFREEKSMADLLEAETSQDMSEVCYYVGQLLRKEAETGIQVMKHMNEVCDKRGERYCNVLSLVSGFDGNVLRDSEYFTITTQQTLMFHTQLRHVHGLREFVVPSSVEKIGKGVFYYCNELEKITIGENVKDIGTAAFFRCKSLKTIALSDRVTTIFDSAFWECTSLETIQLPTQLRTIMDSAFYGCSSLKRIEIPATVREIGDWVFADCSSLESIRVPEGNPVYYAQGQCLLRIDGRLLYGCKNSVIPTDGRVKEIGKGAFWGQSELKEVTIPASVQKIEQSVFVGCVSLEKIEVESENPKYSGIQNCLIDHENQTVVSGCKTSVIPNGVRNIDERAFQGCAKLVTVWIPKSVEKIGLYAFRDCPAIRKIEVDAGNPTFLSKANCLIDKDKKLVLGCQTSDIPRDGCVTVIGEGAFYGCTGLTTVHIPAAIEKIEDFAFSGCHRIDEFEVEAGSNWFYASDSMCLIDRQRNTLIHGCKNSIIPPEVTCIGVSAFDGCKDLTKVNFHGNVTAIGKCAFRNCISLDKVELPDQTHSIGSSAFRGCISLKMVIIGENVREIHSAAFMDCNNLTEIVYKGSKEDWDRIDMGEEAVPEMIHIRFMKGRPKLQIGS
jgi:hypothetical protein